MQSLLQNSKQLAVNTKTLFKNHRNVYIFLAWFIFIAMFLQWALQYKSLWAILSNSGLNIGEKVQEIFQAFINLFILIDDLTPISILLVSLTQSLALTMLLELRNRGGKTSAVTSTGLALMGVGCVSCGGSLLSPVLATIAADISVALARSLGNLVLMVALVLSCKLLLNISKMYSGGN